MRMHLTSLTALVQLSEGRQKEESDVGVCVYFQGQVEGNIQQVQD